MDLTGSFYIIWWAPRLFIRNLLGWPPFVSQINWDDPTPQKRQRQKTKDLEKMEKDKPNANETFWMAIGKKKKHCLYKLSLQRSFVFKNENCERNFGGFNKKKKRLFLYKIFTALDGIPSEYRHEVFTWFVNMMACKCMISGERVTPTARLFLALF